MILTLTLLKLNLTVALLFIDELITKVLGSNIWRLKKLENFGRTISGPLILSFFILISDLCSYRALQLTVLLHLKTFSVLLFFQKGGCWEYQKCYGIDG